MRLEDLMERAAQYDENLARDIKDYVHGRKYGLVYEASKPEFVRMWKKPVVRGDIVNILPPRGVMEDTKNEDDPSEIVYKVIAISEGVATLRNEKTGETVTASVDDIVALARFDKPIYAGLKEIGRVERGGDKPYHVVINGENYHALQTLVYAYQGQVDCIYIDPPYNTGATDWKYNNNYVGKDDKYRHSKWLTFMEDRLRLAKKLLNPKDSVLIVTIDEKEYLRLGLLLEQLFPEARIQMVSTLTKIRQICSEIYEKIPSLDRSTAFAHVISGEGDMYLAPYEVPCVEPQDVQRKSDIRVLFAKEAISTGWDCPRAEVIFSMRPHQDDTYIAQLIGRMVRTPLAESVNIELLNSVSCFLPYFDPATLEKVVKYLTEEGNDDYSGVSRESGREIVTKPVNVEWDHTFGIDDVFTGIASRERAHSTSNYIDGVISYAGMLEENDIGAESIPQETEEESGTTPVNAENTGTPIVLEKTEDGSSPKTGSEATEAKAPVAGVPAVAPAAPHIPTAEAEPDAPGELEKAIDAMLRALNESIVTFNDKFEAARNTVLHAKSTQVELKYLDAASAKTKVYEDDADSYAIANARRRGDVTLSPSVTNAFFRQQILLGMEPLDINVEIAAAAAVPEIVEAVKQSARTKLEKLTEEYDPVIAKYPTSVRNQFSSGMSKHGIPHTVFLDKPVADTQDSGGKKYSKHVVNDPKTHMAWFNLYDSEDAVVMHELRKPEVICWYRNPVGKTTGQSLRIPYRLGDDRKVLHPDFIFFEKVGDREMPAIVDPHGLHLADTMPKLKGIARYVEDFGESFSRYWFVSDYKGQATYLDMKDAETRSVISTASDAYECFAKCGKKYMDGPLSKSKDGYRKK